MPVSPSPELPTKQSSEFVVTIDGPAGTGKSTVSRTVAQAVGFAFLDTGAMYRAVAAACIAAGVDPKDAESTSRVVRELQYDPATGSFPGLEASLRTVEVTTAASLVAQHEFVRKSLVKWQRQYAEGRRLVTEGRDQGTEVFPDAAVKIFLTASADERARRRIAELKEIGDEVNFEDVLAQITARDERDMNRQIAPLRPADDAQIIDTTHHSIEEVCEILIEIIRDRLGNDT